MKIGIIGGLGSMGKVFSELFATQKIECLIADLKTELSIESLTSLVDVVIVSVPISETDKVLKQIAPWLSASQLLVDLTSLKVEPLKEMAQSKAEILGLHPMFGPGHRSLEGQTLIACPLRSGPLAKEFLQILARAGLIVKELTAEKHDKLMAVVQGLNHISSLVMAATLKDLDINLGETLEISSPVFKIRSYLFLRLLSQSAKLYADISIQNPNTVQVLKVLKENTDKIADIVNSKDTAAFENVFKSAAEYFSKEMNQGVENSNKLINCLSEH